MLQSLCPRLIFLEVALAKRTKTLLLRSERVV
jgi:hypothetical protein